MIQEKTLILEEIANELKGVQGIIFTSFTSINANQFANFRKAMFDAKARCVMTKKRILQKALKSSGCHEEIELDDHALFIYSNEQFIDTTKAFVNYRKQNPDQFKLVGGFFEDRLCKASDLELISTLPSLDEARSLLLSLLEAPMSQFLATLEAALLAPVFCVDQKADQGSTN